MVPSISCTVAYILMQHYVFVGSWLSSISHTLSFFHFQSYLLNLNGCYYVVLLASRIIVMLWSMVWFLDFDSVLAEEALYFIYVYKITGIYMCFLIVKKRFVRTICLNGRKVFHQNFKIRIIFVVSLTNIAFEHKLLCLVGFKPAGKVQNNHFH